MPGKIEPEDGQLGVLPLFHIYGMTVVMNATLFNGGAFYPLPAWEAQQAVSLIEEEGLTLVMIEHDLEVVTAVSDRMIVMQKGGVIARGPPQAVTNDPEVARVYTGVD